MTYIANYKKFKNHSAVLNSTIKSFLMLSGVAVRYISSTNYKKQECVVIMSDSDKHKPFLQKHFKKVYRLGYEYYIPFTAKYNAMTELIYQIIGRYLDNYSEYDYELYCQL